jgi:hypothetical protein
MLIEQNALTSAQTAITMKTIRFKLLGMLATIIVIAGVVAAAERGLPKNPLIKEPNTWKLDEDRAISMSMYLEENRDKLIRVTEKPHKVPNLAFVCSVVPPGRLFTPHDDFWIHVFVTSEATNMIQTGQGVYPEGTIILKQKFLDAEAKQTEFYTGMRKREKDYNPEYGDWEFFTLDPAGTKVTARGRIDSCMDCHANWKETDFVSRKYLRNPPAKPERAE